LDLPGSGQDTVAGCPSFMKNEELLCSWATNSFIGSTLHQYGHYITRKSGQEDDYNAHKIAEGCVMANYMHIQRQLIRNCYYTRRIQWSCELHIITEFPEVKH